MHLLANLFDTSADKPKVSKCCYFTQQLNGEFNQIVQDYDQ